MKKNEVYEVSIIVLNYNGFEDTCELIDSLQENAGINYELIVVDNNSAEDESSKIQKLYPAVNCIRTNKNLGFAGGNNVGIKKANADLIMLLNNDTIVPKDSLVHLINRLKSDKSIGAVSPKILYNQHPHKIQFAGFTELSSITLRNEAIGYDEPKEKYPNASKTPFLHGCALMFKKEILKKCGLMPELYFLYYEELDWCNSIKNAGYELFYEPKSIIYHKGSRSVGLNSPLKAFYMTRNRLLFAKRNRFGIQQFLAITYVLLISVPKDMIKFILKGKFKLVKSIVNGAVSYFKIPNKKLSYQ